MTKEEYDQKTKEINAIAKNSRSKLAADYALANNHVAKGDVISGLGNKIIVERIYPTYTCGIGYPECKYLGKRLRKDNTPYKSGEIHCIWQDRIESINGKLVERVMED